MVVATSFVAKHICEGLSTSKAFQDAKKKLGPVHFDAKYVECPENAVEMAKLLKNLDELEKQRMKTVEKAKKNKRILLYTQQSRYNFSKSSRTLSICGDKLPPPGFRYHANGDPKLSLEPSHHTRRTSSQTVTKQDGMLQKQTFIASKISTHLKLGNSPSSQETANMEFEIQKLERMMRELTSYLKRNNIITDSIPSDREKAMPIISARSRDDVLHRCIRERRTCKRQNTFTSKKKSELSATFQERTTSTFHSNCMACHFKNSNKDFNRLRDDIDKTRYKWWNIGTEGSLIKCPSSRLFVGSSFPYSSKSKPTSANGGNSNLDKESKSEAQIQTRTKAFVKSQVKEQVCGARSTQSVPRWLIPSCYSRSVIDAWKEMTEEETEQCNKKVKKFLEALPKHHCRKN